MAYEKNAHGTRYAWRSLSMRIKDYIMNESGSVAFLDEDRDVAVIGNDRFREAIAAMVKRRVTRYSHGGDQKSERFREGK